MDKKSEIKSVLTRRVEKVLPHKSSLTQLMQKRKIRLYQGFDPTATRLHLGHTIGIRKLMEFANLGHETIFLFGTGTVLVGDPSQRDTGRKLITQEEVEANIKNWKDQVAPIVDFEKITIKMNGDWLIPLTLNELINIASQISAVQLFKREMFQQRLKRGDTIWFHETLYPLLQGYDSVVMDVDLEIGGTDQEFNMLIGRELMRKMKNKEKYVLTTPMIVGTDGKQMSKTSGNCIWLTDIPEEMYGKLMRLPDELIGTYMTQLTNIPLKEIKSLPKDPLQNKKKLALDVVSQFHGKLKAQIAQKQFEQTVQQKNLPAEIPHLKVEKAEYTYLSIFSQAFPDRSHSQIKQLIKQGGAQVNGKKIANPYQPLQIKGGEVLKLGKRNFRKLKITNPKP